jgi:hypothetical protein
MKIIRLAMMLALGTIGAGTAAAGDRCNVPAAEWQSLEALQHKLEADGWTVSRTKIEDGCYEAYATDNEGRRVEAYFDPKTFEIVKVKVDD